MKILAPDTQITRKDTAIYRDKGNGTKVHYYIYPEFEIHVNEVAPHTEQEWHHHEKIEEVLMVNKGELTTRWLKDGKPKEDLAKVGDVIRVGSSIHTFANNTDSLVNFTVFRYIPDGIDKHETIKNDRYTDKVNMELK